MPKRSMEQIEKRLAEIAAETDDLRRVRKERKAEEDRRQSEQEARVIRLKSKALIEVLPVFEKEEVQAFGLLMSCLDRHVMNEKERVALGLPSHSSKSSTNAVDRA